MNISVDFQVQTDAVTTKVTWPCDLWPDGFIVHRGHMDNSIEFENPFSSYEEFSAIALDTCTIRYVLVERSQKLYTWNPDPAWFAYSLYNSFGFLMTTKGSLYPSSSFTEEICSSEILQFSTIVPAPYVSPPTIRHDHIVFWAYYFGFLISVWISKWRWIFLPPWSYVGLWVRKFPEISGGIFRKFPEK